MQNLNIILFYNTYDNQTSQNDKILSYVYNKIKFYDNLFIVQQNGIKTDIDSNKYFLYNWDEKYSCRTRAVNRIKEVFPSKYIWLHEFNLLCDFKKILFELEQITESSIIQPFTHIVELSDNSTNEILFDAYDESSPRNIDREIFPCYNKSVIFKNDIKFEELGGSLELDLAININSFLKSEKLLILNNNCFELKDSNKKENNKITNDILLKDLPRVFFHTNINKEQEKYNKKLNNEYLVPMIGNYAFKQQILDDQINSLNKYENKYSDYIIVEFKDINIIQQIQNKTNKKVIPAIYDGSLHKYISSKYFDRNSKDKEYIKYIIENKNKFDFIIFGNAGMELSETNIEMGLVESKLPEIKEKLIFAPFEQYFESESINYDLIKNENTLKNYLKKYNNPCICMCGFWVLYNNPYELWADGYIDKFNEILDPRMGYSPLKYHLFQKKTYQKRPYTYFKKYIEDMNLWSGIGGITGVKNKNLQKLIEYGYKKCIFWTPYLNNIEQNFKEYIEDIQ